VVSHPGDAAETATEEWSGGLWPGQTEGLTVRESEVVAHITLGLSNKEIASRAYLSINSVKSYIRSAYRKMGVTTRSQAVLWAVHHGFLPDAVRYGGEPGTESTA
jgi:two-component system, NarL family, response regulator LiaR